MLWLEQIKDPLHAYQIWKRGNPLRMMAEAVRWGKRGTRVGLVTLQRDDQAPQSRSVWAFGFPPETHDAQCYAVFDFKSHAPIRDLCPVKLCRLLILDSEFNSPIGVLQD